MAASANGVPAHRVDKRNFVKHLSRTQAATAWTNCIIATAQCNWERLKLDLKLDGRAARGSDQVRWRSLAWVLVVCAFLGALGSVVVLALALTVSSDRRIEASLLQAYDRGVLGQVLTSPYGDTHHAYDMWTECVSFSTDLSNTGDGLARRIIASPSLRRSGDTCRTLRDGLRSGSLQVDDTYLRFWHGYLAYTRPLLSIMSLENVRRLTGLLFSGALVFFGLRLARWVGPWTWLIAFPPFFLVGDFLTVPIVTSHALPLIWIFASVAITQMILEHAPNARALLLPAYVFAAGMATNFLSLLFNPPLAPTLIGFVAIAGALVQGRRDVWREALYAGGLIVLWFGGYFTEWVAKWALAASVFGTDVVVADLLGRIDVYDRMSNPGFLTATWANFTPNSKFFLYIGVSIVIALTSMAYGVARGRISRQDLAAFLSLLAPLATVIVWAEANSAHSLVHVGFVSRSFLLFSVIPLLAAALVWRRAVSDVGRLADRPEAIPHAA